MSTDFKAKAISIKERFLPSSPTYLAADDRTGKFQSIVEGIEDALKETHEAKMFAQVDWVPEQEAIDNLWKILRQSTNSELVEMGLMTEEEMMALDTISAAIRATCRFMVARSRITVANPATHDRVSKMAVANTEKPKAPSHAYLKRIESYERGWRGAENHHGIRPKRLRLKRKKLK